MGAQIVGADARARRINNTGHASHILQRMVVQSGRSRDTPAGGLR
jgi:hypothetical protein